jgi:anti-sigma factor RsiW
VSGSCLDEVAAALVDGELDHAARERAQRHLAHCAVCRAEVEAHRSLKARLSRLSVDPPAPDLALTDRLLALSPPGTDRLSSGQASPGRPGTLRPPSGPMGTRPLGRRGVRRRRTAFVTAAATVTAALGVVALALGGPSTAGSTPVDPATDSFILQHVGTTGEVPRVVRATFTDGGARAGR